MCTYIRIDTLILLTSRLIFSRDILITYKPENYINVSLLNDNCGQVISCCFSCKGFVLIDADSACTLNVFICTMFIYMHTFVCSNFAEIYTCNSQHVRVKILVYMAYTLFFIFNLFFFVCDGSIYFESIYNISTVRIRYYLLCKGHSCNYNIPDLEIWRTCLKDSSATVNHDNLKQYMVNQMDQGYIVM